MAVAQYAQISRFRAELATLRAELRGTDAASATQPPNPSARNITTATDRTAGLHARLANIEQSIAHLTKATDSLMERGMIPPTEERLAELQQRFFDPTASDQDRLRSLRLLKRNQPQLSDEIVTQALSMMQSSTNGGTRRDLLRQLDGVTNAAMKQPLLAMLDSETTGNVRESLVDVLSDFATDPAVETKLWDLAVNDADEDVREEAQDALREAPTSPERVEKLRQKALSADASLDERVLSMRALREANVQMPEVVSEMAQLAQNSPDPVMRAKLFQAFDGINDQNLMAPLVNGLQDPNPVVRESAADALSSFASDPRIQEWLNHIIQNDADPRVKREAYQALAAAQNQQQRGGRGGRGGRGR
ncbi:MAG TPA: HEAT repeat domain-containing protein [Verrucomicrobiae bacterium]